MLYEMVIEDPLVDGVFGIGLVIEPAIETNFILLSKDKQNLQLKIELAKIVDEKRKVVCGPILIPDKIIPRKDYDIVFNKETIRTISENFIINNNKDNITLNHEIKLNKVNLIESWIIVDTEKDKSKALGFDLPIGTWMGTYKINDDNLWKEFIETKMIKGFSIEGTFTHKEKVEMSMYNEDEKDILEIYLALNYSKKDLDKNFKWKTSKKDKNCASCLEYDGQVHTLREWTTIAIPGIPENFNLAGLITSYPYSPYSTFCESNCKCKLEKI